MARSRLARTLVLALLLAPLLACQHPVQRNDWSTYEGPGAAYFQKPELDFPAVPDPIEPFNRSMNGFNRALLFMLVDPLAAGWRFVVPQPVRSALVRFFDNLAFPVRLVNNLLQAKWRGAGNETARFLTNTTIGLAGFFDPARSRFGIQPSNEDMGQTFARWGWRNSTFLTLPLFGPSTVRDGIGMIGDAPLNPTFYFFPAGPASSFVTGAEHVDDIVRVIETHQDAYQPARYLWVLNRRVLTEDFEASPEPGAATETLQTVFFTQHDPWFGRRSRTHRVRIHTTGRNLAYEAWMQREPAPCVFVLPGLGAHRRSNNAIALAEVFVNAGFSVVTISSALNFDFMENAATTPVPGFAPIDARDVHVALDAVTGDLERRYPARITSKALVGMSMGGFHTLFIAADESAHGLVDFDRYVALYPPVRLRHGVEQLDAFYNGPLVYPEERREERVIAILQKAVSLATDHDLEPGNPIPLSRLEAEFLIGLAFRLTLHDVIWVSQERHDMGVLRTRRSNMRRKAASREILEFSFMEYLYAFGLPYYRERDPALGTAEALFGYSTLQAIEAGLRANDRIRFFTNDNDFLLTDDDVAWVTGVLGEENVTFYPQGGHMGNLHEEDVQRDVLASLADLPR